MATGQQAAEAWLRGMQQANAKAKAGAEGVTEAPGMKAAAAVDLWLMKLNAARDKYVDNSRSVSTQQWRDAFIKKGLPRMAAGAAEALPKAIAFQNWWQPKVQAAKAEVAMTPRGDLATNLQRMVLNATILAREKYKRGR